MKNIVLTGYMGTGKTTVGTLLAKQLGFVFMDTDDLIVETAGKSISELFENDGEEAFRQLEARCVLSASNARNAVIATGGGVVLNKKNMEALRQSGIVFNLAASPDTILRHTSLSDNRPLINNSTPEDIIARYEARKPFYDDCDYQIHVDDRTPMQVAEEIMGFYRSINA